MSRLPVVYIEPGSEGRITPQHMPDEAYEQAIRGMIIDCTDVLMWDPLAKATYLAKRRAKPNPSWWVIGGRRMPGETPEKSAIRCFERETGIQIEPSRLVFLVENEYLWKDREQQPQDVGCHAVARVFGMVPTKAELAKIKSGLDAREYDVEAGIRSFTIEEIRDGKLHSALFDLWGLARRKLG